MRWRSTVGLESLLQAREQGLRVALGFALPTIALVTILVHLTVRRLLGQPLGANPADDGRRRRRANLHARTMMTRRDELGTIAAGTERDARSARAVQPVAAGARRGGDARPVAPERAAGGQPATSCSPLRESLARAERVAALGQVAANVAHQAGTPLNLVSGYVQMIRDDPRTDDRTRSRLQTVDDADSAGDARAAHDARPRAAAVRASRSSSLADIIERVRETWPSRGCRAPISDCRSRSPSDLPPIRADATQLEMALLNLVTNALDAMPGGGTLSIAATATPDGIRLEVADTGPGIAGRSRRPAVRSVGDDQAGRAGQRSRPGHRPRRRAGARRLDLRVEPASSGAVFSIDLPGRPTPDTERVLAMPRILVVDDDAETCTFLEELLEAPDRQFVSVQDPDSALTRDPQRFVRSADLGHQPERAALGPRSAAPVHGGTGRAGRADQRLRHAGDRDRGGSRRRVRLHQQAVQHRRNQAHRRSRPRAGRRAGGSRRPRCRPARPAA